MEKARHFLPHPSELWKNQANFESAMRLPDAGKFDVDVAA